MDDPFSQWVEDLVSPVVERGYKITLIVYGIPDGTCCYSNAGHQAVYDFMLSFSKKLSANRQNSPAYRDGSFSPCDDEAQSSLIRDLVERLDGLPCIIWCYGDSDECIFARGGIMDLTYASIKTCATVEGLHGGPIFKASMN